MVEESNQNAFLIQIDASSFAEFEISEFEISRFDMYMYSRIIKYFRPIFVLLFSPVLRASCDYEALCLSDN